MRRRILLVEDTRTMLMVEQMMLAGQGFEILTAENGEEGLKRVDAAPPDLILADIVMPVMDGIEMCRRLKDRPDTRDIPIIMATTQGEPEKVEQAFLAGCDDYITKPIDKVELVAKVEKYLA